MATYLKSTDNKQRIDVVLSHLRSNFVNVLCRKCPEETKGKKTGKTCSLIKGQQLEND